MPKGKPNKYETPHNKKPNAHESHTITNNHQSVGPSVGLSGSLSLGLSVQPKCSNSARK